MAPLKLTGDMTIPCAPSLMPMPNRRGALGLWHLAFVFLFFDGRHRPHKYTYLVNYMLTHIILTVMYNNYRRRLKIVIHEREDKTACTIKH